MSLEEWFRGTDFAICFSFPLSVVVFVLTAGLVHGPWHVVTVIGFCISYGSLLGLPLWVVLHIVRDRGFTRAPVLWVESVLAGLWLGIGLYTLLDFWEKDVAGLLTGGVAGMAVALTPYLSRSRWQAGVRSAGRRP